MNTPTTNPKNPANQYPWNNPKATARATLRDFLAIARRQITPPVSQSVVLPCDHTTILAVLKWLESRLDTPPHADK